MIKTTSENNQKFFDLTTIINKNPRTLLLNNSRYKFTGFANLYGDLLQRLLTESNIYKKLDASTEDKKKAIKEILKITPEMNNITKETNKASLVINKKVDLNQQLPIMNPVNPNNLETFTHFLRTTGAQFVQNLFKRGLFKRGGISKKNRDCIKNKRTTFRYSRSE